MRTAMMIVLALFSMEAAACWGFREPKIDFEKMTTRAQVLEHKKKLEGRLESAYSHRVDCYADNLEKTQDEAEQNREYRELEAYHQQVKLTLAKLEKAAEARLAAITQRATQ